MTDKRDTRHSRLKSKFSGNFRSGLKLPTLDLATKANLRTMEEDQELDGISNQMAKTSINVHSKPETARDERSDFIVSKIKRKEVESSKKITKVRHGRKFQRNVKHKTGGGGDATADDTEDNDDSEGAFKHEGGVEKANNRNADTVNDSDSHMELSIGNSTHREKFNAHSTPGNIKASESNSRNKQKGDHLESEINARISSVYRSIESLEKKRINFNNSIRAAARRTVAAGVKNKAMLSKVSASATTLENSDVPDEQPETSRKISRIIDVTRTYPKMFGLDPMKVIASSEDDSDVDDNGVRDPRKKTKKSIRKYLEQLVKEEQPRDMSAIMPALSEKTFLTKLQKRESQLNKEINDMRNNLDVMNMKAEREAKKAKADRNKHKNFNKRNVTRLLGANPDKGPSRELTDFLQGSGGSTGGWDSEDHHVFLKGVSKWAGRPVKLVDNLCQLLPNKKPEEVVHHIAWYEKFEKLQNANRAHIRQWQIQKRREREIVYQMASESQKARLENEKRQQDMIRLRRAEEREKNRDLLSAWKRTKARDRNKKDGDDTEIDTSEKIAKMDLEMSNVRKEIRDITSITKDIGKSLRGIRSTEPETTSKIGRIKTTTSSASSGFCEMTLEEIEVVANELVGDGESFLRQSMEVKTKSKPPSFPSRIQKDPLQAAESKKLLQEFRSRDEEMMVAKKKAILEKKERSRNSAFLSDKQLKERMTKISIPSKLMVPTKQWMIRKEILEQEKIENRNRQNDGALAHESKNLFSPLSYVNSIPKLGTPTWRKQIH